MKIFKVVLAAGLSFFISVSLAGLVQPAPVLVVIETDLSGSAQGDMLTANNSKSEVEFIGCGSRAFSDPNTGTAFEFGFCQAVMDDGSEDGLRAFCTTQDPDLGDAIGRLADYSFITFTWNTNGECIRIGSSTQSFYLPKVKSSKGRK